MVALLERTALQDVGEEEGSGEEHQTRLEGSREGEEEDDENEEVAVQQKQGVEEASRVALRALRVHVESAILLEISLLLEGGGDCAEDVEGDEGQQQKDEQEEDREGRGKRSGH